MKNLMLDLAKAEGHKPRHKISAVRSKKSTKKGSSEKNAKRFISKWTGGPFTANDIRAMVGKSATSSKDTGRSAASYLVVNGLARPIGKKPSSNATIYELIGVSS
ncbi:hypothetical protein [Roseobacter sp. N2S]|uniref:hypothetical protein n=1 Tax=Roseobacter sp. N2S TaxID=2663844 RepID=UPI0028604BB5|nr:hypothetical protein [Roseobacter sp. N2S]MDR6266389.1 hypothetical protein [Roseobacter sp. N2S]